MGAPFLEPEVSENETPTRVLFLEPELSEDEKPRRGYHHQHLPKHSDLKTKYKGAVAEDQPTTLMIRNVPNRYTQQDLIVELENLGFKGLFDFLYLPVDQGGRNRHRVSSVGYAFVNFVDHQAAEQCRAVLHGFNFKKDGKLSNKVAIVSVAHIQGLEANLAHYKNAAVNMARKSNHLGPVVMAQLAPWTDLNGAQVNRTKPLWGEPIKVVSSSIVHSGAPPGLGRLPPHITAPPGTWEPAMVDVAAAFRWQDEEDAEMCSVLDDLISTPVWRLVD